MKDNKIGFSLIEVIISTVILSLSVFGIYKLIAENNKLINNSNNYNDGTVFINNIKNCIENIGFDSFLNSSFNTLTGSFYFENSLTGKCMTGSYSTNFNFESIKINNIEYYLYGKIKDKGENFINWQLGVYNETIGKIEKEYTQWK